MTAASAAENGLPSSIPSVYGQAFLFMISLIQRTPCFDLYCIIRPSL